MEHTKSKWKVSSSFLVCDEEARIIANCQPIGVEAIDIPVHEAIENAKLIAAAPDLMKACKITCQECQEECGHPPFPACKNCLTGKAIKKAERND